MKAFVNLRKSSLCVFMFLFLRINRSMQEASFTIIIEGTGYSVDNTEK